jgi:hypothetical protein
MNKPIQSAGGVFLHPDGTPYSPDDYTRLAEAQISHQNLRKKLWIDVAAAYAAADKATCTDNMVEWADRALEAFDKRFPG